MAKLIFFILALGFFIQTTGADAFILKSSVKTEQCPEDNQAGEENKSEAFKKVDDKIGCSMLAVFVGEQQVFILSESDQYYPPGFSSKPYLPPR